METKDEQSGNILDWDELSDSDKARATELLRELNQIFDKYYPQKTEEDTIVDE